MLRPCPRDSGHYVAHLKDRTDTSGGWTTYDDEDVREVRPSAVLVGRCRLNPG